MTKADVLNFAKRHPVGFCKMPKGFSHLPVLSATRQFMAPSRVDLRDFCTRTEDQADRPWCAAYAAAQWTENIKWRVNDYPEDISPAPIYRYAKSVDGDPNGEGTTINAVLEALVALGHFDNKCRVRLIRPNRLAVKYALHKFGCCLGGFGITDEWYGCTRKNPVVTGNAPYANLGGHCVLLCGYSKDGVWAQNSWGWETYGEYGFIQISWKAFDQQFIYGGVLSNALDGMTTGN